jgi:hypothetical protein
VEDGGGGFSVGGRLVGAVVALGVNSLDGSTVVIFSSLLLELGVF